jgi:hypothetical protein
MSSFKYSTGERVQAGDRIGIDELDGRGVAKKGQIIGVFMPNSPEAVEHNCAATGGILISLEDGDCQLWDQTDEHLILLDRGE